MAFDSTDIRVAGTAHVYLAPFGTAFPDWDEDPAAPWVDAGFVTTDGITLAFNREVTDIFAMQSADPVRTIATRLPKTVAFSMMQQGRDQMLLALGGGTFSAVPDETGVFMYEPPEASAMDERAVIIEMADGAHTYRWHYKRLQNREGVEHKYLREDAATFPVTMQVLTPADGSVPFYLTTDDPAYAAA